MRTLVIAPAVPLSNAMHIHETGRCELPDFESAGGHFAPRGTNHGLQDARSPHAGDLPNIHAPDSGELRVDVLASRVSLDSSASGLLDRDDAALVVHAKADTIRPIRRVPRGTASRAA